MSSHRERLVVEAEALFRTGGFHAVSLDAILRAAKTTKTTFYKHFESKDELALICLQRGRESWWTHVEERLEELGAVDPVDRIHGFFRVLGERIGTERDGMETCFVACGEFPHPTDPCNMAGRAALREIEDRLRTWAEAAGARDADMLGAQLAVAAKGAILHELAHRDGRAASIAADMAAALIERELEPARR